MDNFENNDVLSNLINTLKKQNENIESISESIREIAIQKYYETTNLGRTDISGSVYGVDKRNHIYDPIHNKELGKNLILPSSDYPYQNDNLEKFEKYMDVATKIWKAASNSIEKIQKGFDKLGKTVDSLDASIAPKKKSKKLTFDESESLLEKKGFTAAIRRGIIDTGGLSKQQGFKEAIGRSIGKGLTFLGGVPMSHRRAYAREFLHPELEYKRAISSTEAERGQILPHENELVEERRRKIRKGEINTGHLTEEQDLEQYKKKIIAKANLKAVRKKDVNYRPDLQKQWMVDAGDLELYNSKKILNRAKSEDKEAQLKITKEEKLNHILPLNQQLKSGKINTYGIPHEVFSKQEEQLVVLKNNLAAIEHNSPEYGNGVGGVREKYREQIDKLNKARERAKNDYYGYNKPVESNNQQPYPSSIIHTTTPKNKGKKSFYSTKEKEKEKNPIITGMSSFVSPKDLQTSNFKADKLSVKEFGVTTLNVSNLNAPNLTQNSSGEAVGAGGGTPSILDGLFGSGKGSIRARAGSVLGKAKTMWKPLAKIGARGVVASLADTALGDIAGVGKDEYGNDLKPDTFQDDINWSKMSTGEKVMSSIPRGIESLGNLIGLGNMANQAKSDRIAKETAMYSPNISGLKDIKGDAVTPNPQITPKSELIRGEYIKPIPDQKQSELSNAKNENDQLVQREREIIENKKTAPVILNNNTNNITSKQSSPQSSVVRTSFNAYERFVNRTFIPM